MNSQRKGNNQSSRQSKTQTRKPSAQVKVQKILSQVNATQTPRVRGRGGYWSDFKDWAFSNKDGKPSRANDFISASSGALGAALGAPADLSARAGSFLSRVFGLGSYSVRKNSLLPPMNNGTQPVETMASVARPPAFGSTGSGSDIVFSHSEYITDIVSSVGFNSQTYINNPGNPVAFPWLSQVAGLYEEFEWLGLIYQWRPTSATAVGTTSSAMGVVVVATDYDAYDTNFTNKRAMESAEFSSSAVPYQQFMHPIECDPRRNITATNYVLPNVSSVTGAPGDARLSIPSITTVATQGQQTGGTVIGELWVTYQVRLSRPILESGTSYNTQHITATTNAGNSVITIARNENTVGAGFTPSVVLGSGLNLINTGALSGQYVVLVLITSYTGATGNIWTTSGYFNAIGTTSFPNVCGGSGGLFDSQRVASYYGGAGSGNATGTSQFLQTVIMQVNTVTDGLLVAIPQNSNGSAIVDIFIVPYPTGLTTSRRFGKTQDQKIAEAVFKTLNCSKEEETAPALSTVQCPTPSLTSSTNSTSSSSSSSDEPESQSAYAETPLRLDREELFLDEKMREKLQYQIDELEAKLMSLQLIKEQATPSLKDAKC